MKALMPQTLRHHHDPLVFLHQTNMLRQQGLDAGASEGDRQGGVQAAALGQLDPIISRFQEAAQAGVPDLSPDPSEPAVQP